MATNQPDQKQLRTHFIGALYETLDGVVSPTPYFEITEGETVDVAFLNGKARLPKPNTVEINDIDLDVASLFYDDIHLLWEGHTGVGKSHRAKALGETIFGKDGYVELHLESGVFASSPTEPFTKSVMENGLPKVLPDEEKCRKYGLTVFEEINTGNFNDIRTMSEGYINISGNIARLRMPIGDTGRYKNMAILATMNPSDGLHTHGREMTVAGENRFLKLKAANGVAEAGSSQLEKELTGDLHGRFWNRFAELSGMNGEWREIYPLATDSAQFSAVLDGQTREFIDVALGYVGEDPKETHARNTELMQQGNVQPQFTVKDDNDYRKILQAQGTLKHGFVRRDLGKIRNLSRLLAFIKGVKSGTYEAQVNLNDVASAIGIVLESKTVTGTGYGSLMTLVNSALTTYRDLHKILNIPSGYGYRQAVWQSALNAGSEHGFEGYIHTIRNGMNQLNTEALNAAQATIKSRLLADLVVLEHFSTAQEADVKAILQENRGAMKAVEPFTKLYAAKKAEGSIYEHRLGSIMR